jgi:hypothetical protein
MDLAALFRANANVPVPVDTVLVELRRTSDSSVAFSDLVPASRFTQRSDSLIIPITLELRQGTEQFYLYAEARGGGVVYYTVRSTVTAQAGRSTPTPSLTPTYVGPGNTADSVVLQLSASTVAPGDSVLATTTVFDNGQPVPGVPVGIEPSDSTLVTARPSGLNGAWLIGGPTAGTVSIVARTPTGLTDTLPLTVSITPVPSTLGKVSGDNQTVTAGLASQPLVVQVLDQQAQPVAGFTVNFALVGAPTGTTLLPTTGQTDAQGLAQTVVTAGQVPGAFTVQAAGAGLTGSPQSFAMTVSVPLTGPATVTAQSPISQSGTPGQPVAAAPSVLVRDSNNVPLPNITVSFATTAGNGTVSGGTQLTNASGIATVTSWTLDAAPGSDTLTATVAGLPPVTFTANTGAGAPATVILISGDTQTAPAGAALPLPLVVEVRDVLGVPVQGATVSWATPDGGSLNPTSGSTGANGQAQTLWTLGPTAPTQAATATVGALTPVSFSATATFGPPAIALSYPGGLPNVGLGKSVQVRATIPSGAPAGGLPLTLTSDAPGVAQVAAPATVTIPQGGTFADFTIDGVSLGSTTLRGNATGFTEGTLGITVEDRSISVPPTLNVPYAGTQSLPIVIGSPAPAGGVVVSVTSDNPGAVGVTTPTVTIPAGGTSANATVSGVLPGTANVTVDNPAYSSDVAVVTTSAALNVLQPSIVLDSSFGAPIDIRFESNGVPIAAPAGGIAVTLTARVPACVTTPAATIPAGQVTVSAPLTVGTATLPCSSYVVATAANLAPDSAFVTVQPTPALTFSIPTMALGAGLQESRGLSLGSGNHGGITVRLTSTDSSLVLLAPDLNSAGGGTLDIPVTPGNTFITYTVQSLGGQTGSAPVIATAPGFLPDTLDVTVAAPALDIIFLGSTTTTFSPNSGFQVRTGLPNGQLTGIQAEQAVRAGGPPLAVTLVNDSAAVAQLVTLAVTGQSVTVQVPAGSARSPSGIPAGGVEFDPLGAGVTQVHATSPGFVVLPTASQTVTVSAPSISLSTPNLASGLMVGASGSLGASNHGGTTVRVESRDPSRILVSPNSSTPGSAFIDIPLLNGNSFFSYVVHALEGQTGAVDIVGTAPGFVTDSVVASVNVPAFDIIFLPTTTTSLSPSSGFQVRLGMPNGQLTGIASELPLRTGSPGVTVTLTNLAPAVGQLVTLADTGSPVTVSLGAGESRSPSTVGTGGVEYDPITPGLDSVFASIPGFATLPVARREVIITGQGINLSQPTNPGSGLMVGASGSLGASNHGGVTLRLTSLDPARVLLAPNGTTTATDFIDIPIANGGTFFSYVVHGLEGQTGAVDIVATAPGFTPDTITVTVAPPALDIIFLATNHTTFSPNNGFQVRLGTANGPQTGIGSEQAVRFGGNTVTVALASSTPAVGTLVTQSGSSGNATVSVDPGQSRSPSGVGNGGVEFDPVLGGTTTVSATAPGFVVLPTASVAVTVSAPGISVSSVTVGDGLQVGASVSLGAGNHGGVTVRVTSSDPAIALVAPDATTPGSAFIDVPLQNGNAFFSFVVQGVEGQAGVPAITATASGFTDGAATATVVPAAIDIIFLGSSTTTLSPPNAFQVRTGVPNFNNTGMASEQAVRAGSVPLAVTVTLGNSSVATLQFQGGPASSGQVTINPGQSRSPSGSANGGVEFGPTAAGSTTVSATAPGYLALPTASPTVTITTPGISVSNVTVGAGLETSSSVSLGASNHGGITVRVTSTNPALYLVSPDGNTPGSAFIDVPVNNGGTFFSYVVQGLDGQTGSAQVTVTAPGFANGSATHTVVQSAADIIFLPGSIAAGAANQPFQVRTGIPDALGNVLSQEQARAAGLPPLTATVSNSNATAAQLVTTQTSGQSVQVDIAPGLARSPGTVAAGGVEFDPLAAGNTAVSVSIPLFRVIPASTTAVTVQ